MENPTALEQARQLFARSWAAYSQGELLEAEKLLQETGSLDGRTHRFLLVAKKA